METSPDGEFRTWVWAMTLDLDLRSTPSAADCFAIRHLRPFLSSHSVAYRVDSGLHVAPFLPHWLATMAKWGWHHGVAVAGRRDETLALTPQVRTSDAPFLYRLFL